MRQSLHWELASRSEGRHDDLGCIIEDHRERRDVPTGKQLSALLDDPHLEVIPELTSSIEEEARGLVRDVGVLYTEDEEMSDSSLDRDWEGGPADQRSPPPRASSQPLTSPPPRASPPPLASPPPRVSPSPSSRHVPRVSSIHSDDLYAHLTGFIAEEVGALQRELTERVDDLG
ncbi:uncharacterized protein LOC111412324 [Olea europaea var. sylvestris]|uniref:uncharacterized protein LOC111412324 n=1 Tax=Olea europaea var. sylvestris TaxID=158386 RepID=UPI000C1D06BB|nr:uncharacterized protein LOC111412324 [Olea europaea var. sylvestris]